MISTSFSSLYKILKVSKYTPVIQWLMVILRLESAFDVTFTRRNPFQALFGSTFVEKVMLITHPRILDVFPPIGTLQLRYRRLCNPIRTRLFIFLLVADFATWSHSSLLEMHLNWCYQQVSHGHCKRPMTIVILSRHCTRCDTWSFDITFVKLHVVQRFASQRDLLVLFGTACKLADLTTWSYSSLFETHIYWCQMSHGTLKNEKVPLQCSQCFVYFSPYVTVHVTQYPLLRTRTEGRSLGAVRSWLACARRSTGPSSWGVGT